MPPALPNLQSVVLILLALMASVVFYVRGVSRGLTDSGDFATIYAATRCWLTHTNPYLQTELEKQYDLGHGDAQHRPNPYYTASVYPPSIFPLVAPIAWLDWGRARQVWLSFLVLAFLASLACILRSNRFSSPAFALVVAASFLMFSPVHTGLSKGQPSVLCISFLVCAFYLQRSWRKELLSGVLIGLSCCIKPNFGLFYLAFCCWRRQWRVAAACVATASMFSILGVVALGKSLDWFLAWMKNVQDAGAPGGNMDATLANPSSYLLVNFQTVTGFFSPNQTVGTAITYLLLLALTLVVIMFAKAPREHWLSLTLLSLFVLLGFYHRYYDLQLLMLGTTAAVDLFHKQRWGFRAALITAIVPLWFPLQAAAETTLSFPTLHFSEPISQKFEQLLLFRHQPLCLLLLAVLCTWMMLRKNYQTPGLTSRP